jgi:lysozyme family protein
MKQNFEKALTTILAYEGGYSDHPRDPGGPTNEGITQRVYDGYRRRRGLNVVSVRDITDADVRAIYRPQYWDAIKGDELPAGLDLVMFDSAVNSGPGQATKWLQRALKDAKLYRGAIDGDLGEGTLGAVASHPDIDALIADVLARRLGMLQHLSTWDAFGAGWERRVHSAMAIGQAMATGSVGPAPEPVHEDCGNCKAYAGDVALPLISSELGTKAAAGGSSGAVLVQTSAQKLEPFIQSSQIVSWIYIALIVLSAAIGVGGALSALYAQWKTRKAQDAIDGGAVASLTQGAFLT